MGLLKKPGSHCVTEMNYMARVYTQYRIIPDRHFVGIFFVLFRWLIVHRADPTLKCAFRIVMLPARHTNSTPLITLTTYSLPPPVSRNIPGGYCSNLTAILMVILWPDIRVQVDGTGVIVLPQKMNSRGKYALHKSAPKASNHTRNPFFCTWGFGILGQSSVLLAAVGSQHEIR